MQKILSIAILALAILASPVYSQEKFIRQIEYSFWLGSRILHIDSLPNAGNLDFMNYFHTTKNLNEWLYMGFTAHLWLPKNTEVDIKVFTADDIFPNSFNISVQRSRNGHMGLNTGIYGYPIYNSSFFRYHLIEDHGFHHDTNMIMQFQRFIYDLNWYVGPAFNNIGRFLGIRLKANAGIGSFARFSADIYQQKAKSNFRRKVEYQTKLTPTLFFFPEVELSLALVKTPKALGGIYIKATGYFAKRSIHYERLTYEWIEEKPNIQKVKNPAHWYKKYDVDAGFFFRF